MAKEPSDRLALASVGLDDWLFNALFNQLFDKQEGQGMPDLVLQTFDVCACVLCELLISSRMCMCVWVQGIEGHSTCSWTRIAQCWATVNFGARKHSWSRKQNVHLG